LAARHGRADSGRQPRINQDQSRHARCTLAPSSWAPSLQDSAPARKMGANSHAWSATRFGDGPYHDEYLALPAVSGRRLWPRGTCSELFQDLCFWAAGLHA